jgi:hypothetical protein
MNVKVRNDDNPLSSLYQFTDIDIASTPQFRSRIYFLYLRRKAEDHLKSAFIEIIRSTTFEIFTKSLVLDRVSLVSAATCLISEIHEGLEFLPLDNILNTSKTETLLSILKNTYVPKNSKTTYFDQIIATLRKKDESTSLEEMNYEEYADKCVRRNDNDQIQQRREGSLKRELASIAKMYSSPYEVEIYLKPQFIRSRNPISYDLKEDRIIEINGYRESKVKFISHDILDHAYTFYLLRDLFHKKNKPSLLASLGHPFSRTHMNREGELIAAISYACRQFFWYKYRFPDQVFYFEESVSCHMQRNPFLDYINQLINSEAKGFTWHILANCLLEAEELQLKYGMSLIFDDNNKLAGRLDPYSLDYIRLIIELAGRFYTIYATSLLPVRLALKTEDSFQDFYNAKDSCSKFEMLPELMLREETTIDHTPDAIKDIINMNCHFSACNLY